MVRSIRFGSGLVVARLPNGTWSAPSAIATEKLKVKGQFGMEFTDFVYVLNSDAAVEKFSEGKNFILGQDVSIAVGPFGRSAELAGDSYNADIFAYCKTRAVFGGSTLEGATIGERPDANRKLYQEMVTPRQLLRGEVTLPPETYALMKILHSTWLRPIGRSPSLDKTSKPAKKEPQNSEAVELSSEPPETSESPTTTAASSPVTPRSTSRESRFYGQKQTGPQITIEITDCSAVELPKSLTMDPPPQRNSVAIQPDSSSSSPTRRPTVLTPGRRSWSISSSDNSWSRHDPLPI